VFYLTLYSIVICEQGKRLIGGQYRTLLRRVYYLLDQNKQRFERASSAAAAYLLMLISSWLMRRSHQQADKPVLLRLSRFVDYPSTNSCTLSRTSFSRTRPAAWPGYCVIGQFPDSWNLHGLSNRVHSLIRRP
jgi:hypothetical protein